jgi:hypothetical protein
MTNLSGNKSAISVGLEEYFDVFVLWTTVFEIPTSHEDSSFKPVPNSSKTSSSLLLSMNLDENSNSAQDKPSSHPSDIVLAPSHTQTDLLPVPHKAALVSTKSSISHSQEVKQDNESNTKDSGFRKMNYISLDDEVESIQNDYDKIEHTKIDVLESRTLPPSVALEISPNITDTLQTTPRQHRLKHPSKLISARSVPYSSRSSRISIRPSTPPTPTPASKKPASNTSGLLAMGYKPQNNPDPQDEFL